MNENPLDALMELPAATWGLVIGAVALGWVLSVLWRWYRHRRARSALVSAVTAAGMDHLIDVLVPDGMGGFFHVDFLLLTARGIVVVDLRDVGGNIFGGDQMTEWTVMDGPRRSTFVNPQSALYDRIAAVKALAGESPVEGRIVFTHRARFPKGLPKWTLMVQSLSSEFPAIDRATMSVSVRQFQEAWKRIKSTVEPSSMKQVRVAAS